MELVEKREGGEKRVDFQEIEKVKIKTWNRESRVDTHGKKIM